MGIPHGVSASDLACSVPMQRAPHANSLGLTHSSGMCSKQEGVAAHQDKKEHGKQQHQEPHGAQQQQRQGHNAKQRQNEQQQQQQLCFPQAVASVSTAISSVLGTPRGDGCSPMPRGGGCPSMPRDGGCPPMLDTSSCVMAATDGVGGVSLFATTGVEGVGVWVEHRDGSVGGGV